MCSLLLNWFPEDVPFFLRNDIKKIFDLGVKRRKRTAFIRIFPLLKSLTNMFSILPNKKVFQSKSPMSGFIRSEGPSTRFARVTLIAVDHQYYTLLDSCPDSPSLGTEKMPTKGTKIWKENILIPLSVAVCYRLRRLLTGLTTCIHQDPAGRFRLTLRSAQSWPGDVHSGTIRGWEIEYVDRHRVSTGVSMYDIWQMY